MPIQTVSPSSPSARLLIDRFFEFFTEAKAVIDQFDVDDERTTEEMVLKNLRTAFDEAEKEFNELRSFSLTFFDSQDYTALRRINSEQAEEIRQLKEALAEQREPGVYAKDKFGVVFGPYEDQEAMRTAFGHFEPVQIWTIWSNPQEAPEPPKPLPQPAMVEEQPDLAQPPSDAERQLARAAIDRAQSMTKHTGVNAYEPPPKPSEHPAVWDLVLQDIRERDAFGEKKYGQRLKPFDGRDPLIDLYQELLDSVAYTRKAIYEREQMMKLLNDAKFGIENADYDAATWRMHWLTKVKELLG